jgi:hypothetical protein
MKYMDGMLSESEAIQLNKHLLVCERCKEEFIMYDKILESFNETLLFEAPEGFEESVMSIISTLEPINIRVNNTVENTIWAVWGAVSVILGLGFMLVLNKGDILDFLNTKPELSVFVQLFEPISAYLSVFVNELIITIYTNILFATDLISTLRYFIVAGLVAIACALYLRNTKEKSL